MITPPYGSEHLVFVTENHANNSHVVIPSYDDVVFFTRAIQPFLVDLRQKVLNGEPVPQSVCYFKDVTNIPDEIKPQRGVIKTAWYNSTGNAMYAFDHTNWVMHIQDFLVFSNAHNVMPLRSNERRFSGQHSSEPWYFWAKYLGLEIGLL